MTSNGFEQDIRHSETPTAYERKTAVTRHSIVKCPSEVRHKTFGVQFIAIMPFYSLSYRSADFTGFVTKTSSD